MFLVLMGKSNFVPEDDSSSFSDPCILIVRIGTENLCKERTENKSLDGR